MIDLTIKVSCVVVLALLVSALARRRSAAFRHWILTTAILSATSARKEPSFTGSSGPVSAL